MPTGRLAFWWVMVVAALALGPGSGRLAAQGLEVPLISPDDLKPGLCSPTLTVIDVRAPDDWTASAQKIKCAVREDPHNVAAWARKYPPAGDIVLYCA